MGLEPQENRLARSTRRAALILGIGGALLLPAAATADPGTPGLSAAQDAVYPTSVGPNVLGEQTTPTTPSNPTTPTSVQQPTVAAAQTSPAAGGGDDGGVLPPIRGGVESHRGVG